MKKITALCVLLVLFVYASATNYYVKSGGNDKLPGTSDVLAWGTIAKVNKAFAAGIFKTGDSILFRRGDFFPGRLIVTGTINPVSHITFGAYHDGAKPVITGFEAVKGWKSIGGNIWESAPTHCKNTLSMLTINGLMTAKGRYPNSDAPNGGYATFKSYTGIMSITDPQLPDSPNWKGATLVMRVSKWNIQVNKIVDHAHGTIKYTGGRTKPQYPSGLGYFIEDDIHTLDTQNEWYLDKATKKIFLYSRVDPGTLRVEASIYDTIVTCKNNTAITFMNLKLEGANLTTMYIADSPGTQVLSCDIDFSGGRGIWAFTNENFRAEGNTISHTNSNAMYLSNINATIISNTIKDIGLLPGMATQGTYHAIHLAGNPTATLIQYNSLDSLGSNGMYIMGNNIMVKNNFINHFGLTTDDCGGIYALGESNSGRIIADNIILNGLGNTNGALNGASSCEGIYIDEPSTGNYITGNTVANCGDSGLKFHNAYNMIARDNTFYNNHVGVCILKSNPDSKFSRNLILKHNTIAAGSNQSAISIINYVPDDPLLFGKADSNYFYVSENNNQIIKITQLKSVRKYSIASWANSSGHDMGSKISNLKAIIPSDILFEYNATRLEKTIQFNRSRYYDKQGASYINSISLAPYSSVILIRDAKYRPVGN